MDNAYLVTYRKEVGGLAHFGPFKTEEEAEFYINQNPVSDDRERYKIELLIAPRLVRI